MDRTAGQTRRMLVVDDEKTIRTAIANWFERNGYEVDVAEDVGFALILVRERTYDLAIVDMNLGPDARTGGLDILRHLASVARGTAVLVLTASGSAALYEEAGRLGARAVLSKPQPLAELARVATEILRPPRE